MNKQMFSEFSAAAVDRDSAKISGVSLISVGEAKGHSDFDSEGNKCQVYVDGTTLEMVGQLCAGFGDEGVKVKVDHWSGFDGIVGTITNTRVEEGKVRGDLQLLQEHPAKDRILEMAETMPSQFGLSISFSGQNDFAALKDAEGNDILDGEGKSIQVSYARPAELFSVDLVDSPAANADGLFSKNEPEIVRELTALREQVSAFEAVKQDLENATKEIAFRDKKITKLEAALDEATKNVAKIETLYSALKKAACVAGAASAPQVTQSGDEGGSKSIREQYEALEGAEKREFRRRHWQALVARQ